MKIKEGKKNLLEKTVIKTSRRMSTTKGTSELSLLFTSRLIKYSKTASNDGPIS